MRCRSTVVMYEFVLYIYFRNNSGLNWEFNQKSHKLYNTSILPLLLKYIFNYPKKLKNAIICCLSICSGFFFMVKNTLKLRGHRRSHNVILLIENLLLLRNIFYLEFISSKLTMNANNANCSYKMKYAFKCQFHATLRFCDHFFPFRPSDLFITLSYFFMDNFCPCFHNRLNFKHF